MKILSFCRYWCFLLFFIPFLFAIFSTPAQETAPDANRIAVLDFDVQSENPQYKFLGKGFAEFIAVNLSQVKGITIIDREKRNDVMEEQKFTLTGMTDESTSIEIGHLLAANYLISGSIFDMFGNLEVTVQLIDIELGSIAVNAQAGGEPKQYKKIIGELSGALVAALDLGEEAAAEVEPEPSPEAEKIDNEDADVVLSSFSKAIDAVDKNNVQEAKKNLQQVQKIDKTNEAAQYYLNKLFLASPKFNVELIFYAPSYNPAYLGFIKKDRMYLTGSMNLPFFYVQYPVEMDGHRDFKWEVKDGLYYSYDQLKTEIGYYFPIGEKVGLGAEFSTGASDSVARDRNYSLPIWDPADTAADNHVYIRSGAWAIGGRLGIGFQLHPSFAFGLSGYLFNYNMNLGGSDGPGDPESDTFTGAATLGLFFRFLDGGLTIDTHATVPFFQEVYIDYDELSYIAYRTAPYPGVLEANIVGKVANGRLFLSLKEVLEIYTSFGDDDRTGVASRAIPAIEWWPFQFMSIRAGGEYDFMSVMGKTNHGAGVLGGMTFRIGPVDIDANFTYMSRALRFYPGLSVPDTALLVQVSWNGAFIKER